MKYLLILLCSGCSMLHAQQSSLTWKEFVLGTPGLSIDIPGTLLPQDGGLPQDISTYVKNYEAFYMKDEPNGIVITLMHITYTGEIIADLVGAANGTVTQWEGTGAKVDVQTFSKQITADRNSVIQKGLFSIDGKESIFTNLVIGEGASMWQVVMIVPANNVNMQKAMDRLYTSIRSK